LTGATQAGVPALLRRAWPAVKVLLAGAVAAAVGWEFARTLRSPELRARPWRLRPQWLAAAPALYLSGLGCSALFWYTLPRVLGQRPHLLPTLRAYSVGQLGRYVPGKVVGLWIRARLLAGPGVRLGAAVLTVVYETQFLAADLSRTLGPGQAEGMAVVAALLPRLLWTVADLAAAGVCYWLPAGGVAGGERPT
jgi:hypothetical protein